MKFTYRKFKFSQLIKNITPKINRSILLAVLSQNSYCTCWLVNNKKKTVMPKICVRSFRNDVAVRAQAL